MFPLKNEVLPGEKSMLMPLARGMSSVWSQQQPSVAKQTLLCLRSLQSCPHGCCTICRARIVWVDSGFNGDPALLAPEGSQKENTVAPAPNEQCGAFGYEKKPLPRIAVPKPDSAM